jgi:hypothetical protein
VDFSYPVLCERPLPAVPHKFMRSARRDLTQLPDRPMGCVLVFHVGHQHVVFRENVHLSGTEEVLVGATAVSVVDLRARVLTAQVMLPSASAADDFTIRAGFRCQVTQPEVVAEHGVFSLPEQLECHLRGDRKLLGLGKSYRVEQIAAIRDMVEARVEAYWEYHPFTIPGLEVTFTSAEVLTPGDLRVHEVRMRDERWNQDYVSLASNGENSQIERMRALVADGSASLTALGLARGQIHPADAVRDARENEERVRAHLSEAVRLMHDSGRLDYIDIDPAGLVGSWYAELTGHPMPRPGAAAIGGAAIGGGEQDSDLPDEADLDG